MDKRRVAAGHVLVVEEDSPGAAWLASLRPFLTEDLPLLDSNAVGGPYYERSNEIIVVRSPLSQPQVSTLYAYPDLLEDYDLDPRTPSVEARELSDRIRRWEAGERVIDQLQFVVETLRRSPNSRRAVISLWNPAVDTALNYAVCPCTFQLVLRPRTDGTLALNGTLLVRSSDAWVGAPLDLWAFVRLQCRIADALDVPVGPYVHHAVSYHLYYQYIAAVRIRLGLA